MQGLVIWMSNKDMVSIRVPREILDKLVELMNQDTLSNDDGSFVKREALHPLVMKNPRTGEYSVSNNKIVNLALLGFMSGLTDANEMMYFVDNSNLGRQDYRLASERLCPKGSVVIPASFIHDMANYQKNKFELLESRLDNYQSEDAVRSNDQSQMMYSMLKGLAWFIGFSSNSNEIDKRAYFNDERARTVIDTLLKFNSPEGGIQSSKEDKSNGLLDVKPDLSSNSRFSNPDLNSGSQSTTTNTPIPKRERGGSPDNYDRLTNVKKITRPDT